MTECSICTEVFIDPRVLPCQHTFCLKCLLNYGNDRQPGDRMPCPLCRKEFTIPDIGLSGIQKNFEKEKLIQVRMLLAGQKTDEKMSDDFRNQMAMSNKQKISEIRKTAGEVLQRLQRDKNDVIKHLASVERDINKAADTLIAAIQRDKVKLLSEVKSIKLKRVKELKTTKQELEEHMKLDVMGHVDNSLPPVDVTFTSSTMLDGGDRNLVGTLTSSTLLDKDDINRDATLIHVVAEGQFFTAQCTLVHLRGLGIACRPSVRPSVCPSVRL